MENNSIFNKIKGPPLNSFKGLLIILIVIGHNRLVVEDFQNLRHFLYFFHAQMFLVLGVVLNKYPLNLNFIRDKIVRLLVPYFSFLTIYTLIFNLGDKAKEYIST